MPASSIAGGGALWQTRPTVLTGRGTRRGPVAAHPEGSQGGQTQTASRPSRDRHAWHGERAAGPRAGEWCLGRFPSREAPGAEQLRPNLSREVVAGPSPLVLSREHQPSHGHLGRARTVRASAWHDPLSSVHPKDRRWPGTRKASNSTNDARYTGLKLATAGAPLSPSRPMPARDRLSCSVTSTVPYAR